MMNLNTGEPLGLPMLILMGVAATLIVIAIGLVFVGLKWGSYWLQAYMSGTHVSMKSLVAMSFLKIDHRLIVTAKIMMHQAGLAIAGDEATSTARLQAHVLAGGDVANVVKAIIAAHRADLNLDFDQATAIDLAGRDVLRAVQQSVLPHVIQCPRREDANGKMLSAVAKDGIELLVVASVTVRTNLERLIGGATEETIIARVGQAIISSIGSSPTHMDVLASPSQISKGAMTHGLDSNTAFSIVSIDVANIDVGENIGARLQVDQAEADIRIARAFAEVRRAEAVASAQEMKAKVTESHAMLVLAEAEVPQALATAFRMGRVHPERKPASSCNALPRSQAKQGGAIVH